MTTIFTLSQGKEIITNGAEREHLHNQEKTIRRRPEFTNRHMYIPSYPFHIPQVRKHKKLTTLLNETKTN